MYTSDVYLVILALEHSNAQCSQAESGGLEFGMAEGKVHVREAIIRGDYLDVVNRRGSAPDTDSILGCEPWPVA